MQPRGVEEFHRLTEHAPHATAPGGPFDPRIEPAKAKRYPDRELLPLPVRWDEPRIGATSVLSAGHPEASLTPDRESLARLLFLADGVTRTLERGGRRRHFRAAPSAGALYPIETYVVCRELDGLAAGVYHHEPEQHGLHRLRAGDHRRPLARAAADEALAVTPLALVLTGILWRTSWKYGPRGYRHLYWDAGTVTANALAAADSAGWPARVLSGFVDGAVGDLLDLGDHLPFTEWPLVVIGIGEPDGRPAPEPDSVEPLGLAVEPLSSRRVEEPAAEEIHAATTLPEPDAVAVWRNAVRDAPLHDAAGPRLAAPAAEGDPTIEEVILQRGSTRAFARDPVPGPAADWCVRVGMRPVPGDLAAPDTTPLVTHLAVHALEDREPGGYRWDPGGWERVVDDQPRVLTAHLCLDQDLGGTAAVTAFLGAELNRLVAAAGPRAYRVAELAAGITAGRLQLGAFTLGLGGTGLTFYDDEVRRHFGTTADPMLVTALGRPAYDARAGRRPSSGSLTQR